MHYSKSSINTQIGATNIQKQCLHKIMIGIILFFIFSYFKGRIISKNLCENGPQSSVISMTSDLNFSLVCDLFLKYTPPVIILLYIIKLNDDLFGLLPCGPPDLRDPKKTICWNQKWD